MKIQAGYLGRDRALQTLFAATFTALEGTEEGQLIGGLVRDLLATTQDQDLRVFRAEQDATIVGAAIFTRLIYPQDPHRVFLLSPMAVALEHQRKGIGQTLIKHALVSLKGEGVQVVMTYGDPAYYGRLGFRLVPEMQARAPLPLKLPHGWIGQSLTDVVMPNLNGPSVCVPALNRGEFW